MPTILLAIFVVGINFTLWAVIGCLRVIDDRREARFGRPLRLIRSDQIAVLIAAHNEEPVLRTSIDSVTPLLGHDHVFVVSDGSTDGTVEVARRAQVAVLDLHPNRGKVGALKAGLEHFALLDRFAAVMFLDADSEVHPRYFKKASLQLADADVAAVAGYCKVIWRFDGLSLAGKLILGHRNRLYTITQMLQKFGQTWKRASVCYIVPGFASIYRTDVLRMIDIDPHGLVIEDFNMTFEVHRKHLGRISLTRGAAAFSQDPHTLRDYISQVRRWNLGFWQTIRHHGVWASWFWAAVGLFVAEVITSSILLLLVPVIALVLALPDVTGQLVLQWRWFAGLHDAITTWFSWWTLLYGVVLPDYALTVIIAVAQRRPRVLLLGLCSLPFRMLDAWLGLSMMPKAWTTTSTGQWRSPQRRSATQHDGAADSSAA